MPGLTRRRNLLLVLFAVLCAVSFGAYRRLHGAPDAARTGGSSPTAGFRIEVPIYTLASWDPSRIAAFSFRLSPATDETAVRASVSQGFADSCRLESVTHGTAIVTCSYQRNDAPTVLDAVALTVIASG